MRMFSTVPHSLKNSLMSSSLADHARFFMKMVELPCAADVSTFAAGATLAFFAGGAACRPVDGRVSTSATRARNDQQA